MSADKDIVLIQLLKDLISKAGNGSITFSKQNGEIMRLTAGETHLGFENFSDYVNAREGTHSADISDSDLNALLAYLEKVLYGTVTIRLKDSQIVGFEKNETYKVK